MPRLCGAIPEGCVPFTPMPYEPTLKVAVLPMKEWARRNSLDATSKHKATKISIQGQAEFPRFKYCVLRRVREPERKLS
jgi:hypothetical protein